jgi:prevent-host-death family protein
MKLPIRTVGSYEAKTRLPALLKEVAAGREIIITLREKPIARLVPMEAPLSRKYVFERIRAFRMSHSLPKGVTAKDLINEGRRI